MMLYYFMSYHIMSYHIIVDYGICEDSCIYEKSSAPEPRDRRVAPCASYVPSLLHLLHLLSPPPCAARLPGRRQLGRAGQDTMILCYIVSYRIILYDIMLYYIIS